MTKRIRHKYKISVRFGEDIWGDNPNKKIKLNKKKNNSANLSEYGTRLLAKQKLKNYYCNINEKQFKNIYKKALKYPGKTYENLLILLERRLDTIVYRLNFASSFYNSRQLISHSHILVNGNSVNIPSYTTKNGDIISIRKKSKPNIYKSILNGLSCSSRIFKPIPPYLEVNYKTLSGCAFTTPIIREIPYRTTMEIKKALEFYKG